MTSPSKRWPAPIFVRERGHPAPFLESCQIRCTDGGDTETLTRRAELRPSSSRARLHRLWASRLPVRAHRPAGRILGAQSKARPFKAKEGLRAEASLEIVDADTITRIVTRPRVVSSVRELANPQVKWVLQSGGDG